jgi:AraC-like DNA-binding protein
VRYPDGLERSTWVPGENHIRTVGMYYDPYELRTILGYGSGDVTDQMHPFIARQSRSCSVLTLPCTREMQRAALSLFNTPFRGRMRTAFARARATELVCWSLKAMVDMKTSDPPPVKLSDRDIECLLQARELLLSSLKNPPTISVLSRKVGINRNKLSYGFKYLFGECVSEFCQNMRMERAWKLLTEDRLTISQIADEVGYSHPQNFSTAFRQHHGMMPKDVRRS